MRFLLFAMLAIGSCAVAKGQDSKEVVVVMNNDYTYTDPRWEQDVTLKCGEAITVIDTQEGDYEYWPYPAADVAIPREVTHIPGTVEGERCLIIKSKSAHFFEKPSGKSNVYCYNIASTASVYHIQFIPMNKPPKKDEYGLTAEWEPMTLNYGT
ncbi:MAG: hypothetical protein IK092_06380, partial [Muribaculaceae bacterium]|nr:hypothetical protein [Muribaculaceae bacterium]